MIYLFISLFFNGIEENTMDTWYNFFPVPLEQKKIYCDECGASEGLFIFLCWSHCDTAPALSLQSATNKLQMAAESRSFILYFQWNWQMVRKGLSTPTCDRLCQQDWCNNQQEDVTVMKNETKKKYIYIFLHVD